MKRSFSIVLVIIFISIIFLECKKRNIAASPIAISIETDTLLYAKAMSTGYGWYKNDAAILKSATQTGHKAFFRVRFNSIARAAMTDNGKLPVGVSYPIGSLIVKELHTSSTDTNYSGYAIMEKLPADSNASGGWVWAEYTAGPASGIMVQSKGAACINCHSTNSRDMVRLFDLFP